MWVGRNTLLYSCLGLAAACAVLSLSARAQQQDSQTQQESSVADAARRTREEKKKPTKPTKVITDDDLATLKPGGVNVGGPPESQAEPPNPKAVAKDEAAFDAALKPAASKPGENPEIAELKDKVAAAAKDLDLLKREFALDSDTYYSKPNYSDDPDGKAKLDGEQQQIGDKQQEVDDLKARLKALEDEEKEKSESAQAPPDENAKPATPPAQSNPPQL